MSPMVQQYHILISSVMWGGGLHVCNPKIFTTSKQATYSKYIQYTSTCILEGLSKMSITNSHIFSWTLEDKQIPCNSQLQKKAMSVQKSLSIIPISTITERPWCSSNPFYFIRVFAIKLNSGEQQALPS